MNAKLEAAKQWDADPCGAVTAGALEPGTPEFFARVEIERYGAYAPWMPEVLDLASFRGQDVLEIGPGLGTDHARLARGGARMFGIDLSRRHLELTRARFRVERLTTRLTHGDVEHLPFPSAVFDAVYAFGVIHHTPAMDRAIGEIHRVLRPGGLALIALYHKHSAFYWVYTILVRGVVQGGLLRKGYRGLLSEIEHRSEGSEAAPLVQVVSRRQCRRLFAPFAHVTIRSAHIDAPHIVPRVPSWPWRYRRYLERIGGRFGWYLVVSARKATGGAA